MSPSFKFIIQPTVQNGSKWFHKSNNGPNMTKRKEGDEKVDFSLKFVVDE